MLTVRSGSVMELGHGLPIETTDSISRFQWIKRFLGNDLVDVDEVMGSFSREVLRHIAETERQQQDQNQKTNKINSRSLVSAFKTGIRTVLIFHQLKQKIPSLWSQNVTD